ncbi:MAG: NlpC/P60 family protein [Acidimicrobiia bacterium]
MARLRRGAGSGTGSAGSDGLGSRPARALPQGCATGRFLGGIELRRRLLPLLLAAGIGGAVLTPSTVALGTPTQSLEAQATALQDEVEKLGQEAADLGEAWNEAKLRVQEAEGDIADAEAGIADAEYQIASLQDQINARAASIYRSAGNSGPVDIVDVDNVQDFAARSKYADVARDNDEELIDEASRARDDLEVRHEAAEAARDKASTAVTELEEAKAAAEAKLDEQQALLNSVEGELAAAREAEAARRRAQDPPPPAGTPQPSPGGGGSYDVPPPGAGAAAAVEFAIAQVGKPYCYAGVGPDCFDCSGLVTAAYGMTLPHGADTIQAMFPKVPMDQLQPGDVVWNPGHDGIYIGGGTAVHATHTGDFVRYIGVDYFSSAVRIV